MKNKFIFLGIISVLVLSSCKKNTETNKEYVISWVNYDGSVLESDFVKEGELPVYNGETPSRASVENIGYSFIGWSPEVSEAKSNITYTAVFNEETLIYDMDYEPVLYGDDIMLYGMYPKSYVSDVDTINALNALESPSINNWYKLEDTFYAKVTSNIYNNEEYTFDDGTIIENESIYYFEVEFISWKIINQYENIYTLLATDLIDATCFNSTANNSYKDSDIRTYLNTTFYNTAFAFNNSFIVESRVDDMLNEKVYLLSKDDYLNTEYGFDNDINSSSSTRTCKITEYARSIGGWYNKRDAGLIYNSSYWTRTSSNEFSYASYGINSSGFISEYSVERNNHCIRPCIRIQII